ncbi:hypothetical protein BD779DRAFT_1473999 [Infundibulicybe gibba]|nr:hypothetical protein BD779DRAFT_1473999 [Infundibulicybe gibba]
MTSETKTAEFARLFDLFERLASRNRKAATPHDGSQDPVPVPTEFAPVLKSLATIVGTARSRSNASQPRPRRNTTATFKAVSRANEDDSEDVLDDDENTAIFPFGGQFPFTFKLMLHKLYALEDWADKVKEVLERSQSEYKPLVEARDDAGVTRLDAEEKAQSGHVRFKIERYLPPASPTRPELGAKSRDGRDDVRAIKKRCIGRRKSMSGPHPADAGQIGNRWTYDAAVSSVEINERRVWNGAQVGLGFPWPETLGQEQGGGRRKMGGMRRRVSVGTPRERGGDMLSTADDGGLVARRRALSTAHAVSPDESRRMKKRPLSS